MSEASRIRDAIYMDIVRCDVDSLRVHEKELRALGELSGADENLLVHAESALRVHEHDAEVVSSFDMG